MTLDELEELLIFYGIPPEEVPLSKHSGSIFWSFEKGDINEYVMYSPKVDDLKVTVNHEYIFNAHLINVKPEDLSPHLEKMIKRWKERCPDEFRPSC